MNRYYTIGVCLILGGCMLEQNVVLEKDVQEEIQRAVVTRIVELYEPVTSVVFGVMHKSNATGGWHGEVVVNDVDRIHVSFSYDRVEKKLQMVQQVVDRQTLSYRGKTGEKGALEGVRIVYGELE